jgi:hypothetical protein
MNACVAESVTKSELIDKAANNLRHMQKLQDVAEHEVAAKLLLFLKKPQKPKGKKTYRRRRRTVKNNIEKASTVFQDRIRKIYDFSEVINLLGECIFYESLFIWQNVSLDRFKNQRCSNSCGLVGDILLVLEGNYKALFELFMELPSMQSSKHYPVVVRSEDVSNQALQRASELVFDFLSTRDLSLIISPFCAKQIKVYYVPIELIMIPIEETFLSCLHIVH